MVAEPPKDRVKPLHSRAPKEILMDLQQADLPQASLIEHFEREAPYIKSCCLLLPHAVASLQAE